MLRAQPYQDESGEPKIDSPYHHMRVDRARGTHVTINVGRSWHHREMTMHVSETEVIHLYSSKTCKQAPEGYVYLKFVTLLSEPRLCGPDLFTLSSAGMQSREPGHDILSEIDI